MADPEITELRAIIAARPRATEIAQMRLDADARAKAFPLPADVTVQPVVANGVQAEWTSTPDADPSSAILYLHGGGYVICSLDSHRHLVAEIGRASGTRTLAIDYRLAPEHPFPAPVEDTVAAYRYLLDERSQAEPHRLGWRQRRRRAGGRRAAGDPARRVCRCRAAAGASRPGWTWRRLGESFTDRAAADPTVQRETIRMMAQWYLGGADPRHPHAAPIYGDLRGLPPLLIQVGAAETLLDDAVALARKAGAADVLVDLQIWPEMIHIWHIFFPMLSAGRRAIASGGTFVRNALRP